MPEAAYHERLTPPPLLWMVVLLFGASFVVAFGAAGGPALAAAAALLVVGPAVWVLLRSSAVVEVVDGRLRAGRAAIPVALLGPPRALDADAARLLRGPQADPAAYLLLRGWVPEAVVADVRDPADPTPYWYVATRHPQRLAAAVAAAQRRS